MGIYSVLLKRFWQKVETTWKSEFLRTFRMYASQNQYKILKFPFNFRNPSQTLNRKGQNLKYQLNIITIFASQTEKNHNSISYDNFKRLTISNSLYGLSEGEKSYFCKRFVIQFNKIFSASLIAYFHLFFSINQKTTSD